MYGVTITDLIRKMDFKNLTPELDTEKIVVSHPDVNRPALQLAGFYDRFDSNRVQIIGNVENRYVQTLSEEQRMETYEKLLQHPIPCIVFCRDVVPEESFLKTAVKYGVPIFNTVKQTSDFMAEIIRWMNVRLAPCISIKDTIFFRHSPPSV